MQQLSYTWRLFATALSFSIFGLGSLMITLFIAPASFMLGNPRRENFAKSVIHRAFGFFCDVLRVLGVLTFRGSHLERLQAPGQLIIANHPTLLDIVFLIGIIPRADCIVNGQLLKNVFFRSGIRLAGYISNDNPEKVVEQALASLQRGNSLIIFPEGTRSKRNQSLHFQRGAANIAIRTGQALRPVVIACEPLTLGKHEPWYRIPAKRFKFMITVNDPVDIEPYLRQETTIAARKLTRFLESYFMTESRWHERAGN